jgi:hypothetical protein
MGVMRKASESEQGKESATKELKKPQNGEMQKTNCPRLTAPSAQQEVKGDNQRFC